MNKRHTNLGFTITEVMIAATILLVAVGLGLNFSLESIRGTMFAENKSKINADIRKLTNELLDNAKAATYFRLYNSFENTDRNEITDVLYEGNSGNFIALVTTGNPDPDNNYLRPIERIVGYLLDTNTVNEHGASPIRKFEVNFNPGSTATLESIIPDESQASNYDVLSESVFGLANSKAFYNFWDKSIMVNTKILHGSNAENSTDTYNITISPRG